MNTALIYIISYILLFAVGVLILRYLVPHAYLKHGKLSSLIAFLQALLFFVYGGFPYIYLPRNWPAVSMPPLIHLIGVLLIFIGLAFLLYGMIWLGVTRSMGRGKAQLVQTGIYTNTRNPQAIACGLYVIGFLMLWPSWYAVGWALLYFVLIHMMILTEERYLERLYGRTYQDYCAKVPRYIRLGKIHPILLIVAAILLLMGCRQELADCPPVPSAPRGQLNGLISADAPIQFPLDDYTVHGPFESLSNAGVFENKRHAAEDSGAVPGTAVYAIADGEISFSGEKGGYGLLIIIDHPQTNTYSLYGHLSPSRWHRGTGPVAKGDLIAYIGDSDENGSSAKYGEMSPHLHFGIRQGQRNDYPNSGDWRWTAGWTYECPSEIGWMQPSQFIINYEAMSQQTMQAPAGAGWRRYLFQGFLLLWFTAVAANGYRLHRKKKRNQQGNATPL